MRAVFGRGTIAGVAVVAVLACVVGAVAGSRDSTSDVGKQFRRTGNGRLLTPQGKLIKLGNFPTGAAATPDGRFYWTVSTGRGLNDVRIVSVRTRKVIQTIPIPGGSGGIVMDPTRRLVYVSGVADSGHKDQERPGLPGREGDVVHVFKYAKNSGRARFKKLIPTPPPSDASAPQTFPPTNVGEKVAWPDRLAISSDGNTLLVPLNLADAASIVDVKAGKVRATVKTGNYPYGAAILRDGKTGLVSNETPGTVSVIDLAKGTKVKDIQVGPRLSHPEAIEVDPKADRAYVALANSDQVVVIDTAKLVVERTLSVGRSEGLGTSPVDVAVTPDGRYLYVAESGADELAVFRLPGAVRKSAAQRRAERILAAEARRTGGGEDEEEEEEEEGEGGSAVKAAANDFALIGRIPVAAYPQDVSLTPATKGRAPQVLWTAGKGLGTFPNLRGPDPTKINDDNASGFQYLPVINYGRAGILPAPTEKAIKRMTPLASRQLVPDNAQQAPEGTPLRPNGPIKHVFYIVRENRTYDQILGDEPRGDGDPKLAVFGKQVTPNIHALVQRFPLLDRVFANSEASIDGHYWTAAAKVSDYVNKNWFQNYADRGRPYDFGVFQVSNPPNGFLFDQAQRQGISWFNYGEAVADVVPLFPDKDRTPEDLDRINAKFAKSDVGPPVGCYPNDAFISKNGITQNDAVDSSPPPGYLPTTESRFDCFKTKFSAQLATDSVPAFNYIVLPRDHTEGSTPGRSTPRAAVAENDYALGQFVDLISHSKIWSESAIFVIEDDSQDGADHVDAHRIPAAVISPYAKRGAVVSTRYDFLSVIRSLELILGMKPLGLFDALATPMYDAFESTPVNAEPFTVVQPTYDLSEKNPKGATNARLSRSYDLNSPDQIPQRVLDKIIWQSVYGKDAQPPPPGPNNSPGG
jgi:DNA-binding beta-propeller fold protein YncE